MPQFGHPFVYVMAYMTILYIRPHEYVPWMMGVPILPVLLGLSLLFWIGQEGKRFESPQHRLVPVLFFFIVFSVLLTGWMGGTLKAFNDFLPTMLLFFMLSTAIDSLERLRSLFKLIAVAGTIMAIHGIQQAGTDDGIGWTGAKMIERRITYLGFLNDPNDLAMALLMGLPMVLYLSNTVKSFFLRLVYRAAAGVTIYGVYLTNSRGGLLSLGAMTAVYSMIRYGFWKGFLVLPVFGAALVLFAPSRGGEISADEESAAGRVEAWYEGFQMLRAHPLFGVGYNMFVEHHIRTAHNSYVLAIAELGILGYYVWLSNLVLTALMLVQVERTSKQTQQFPEVESPQWRNLHAMARALLYGMIGAATASMFLSRSYTVIWYVQIAMVVALYQLARRFSPAMPAVTFSKYWGRLFVLSNLTVFMFWLLTRVLL